MIELWKVLDFIAENLEEKTGIQVVQGNINHPPGQLELPRLVITFTSPYISEPGQPILRREVVDYDPEYWDEEEEGYDFENDLKYINIERPTSTLSIIGVGSSYPVLLKAMNEARDWFKVRQLGKDKLKFEFDAVVRDVMDINDITTDMEDGFQQRFNFDVILGFVDIVKVRVRTIESVDWDYELKKK